MTVPASLITFAPGEISAYYAARVPGLKQREATEWRGPCAIHQGTGDNFAVNSQTGQWFCHSQCSRGGSLIDYEMELAGVDFRTAKQMVFEIIGRPDSPKTRNNLDIERTYDYTDIEGNLLYQVVRFRTQKKDERFRQRRPDGCGGWIWKTSPTQVLYRLREVLENPIVFLPEGEKDCETLRSYGFVATTNSGGAGAPWLDSYTECLRGREALIVPDNDAPGWKHAAVKARALLGAAAKIRIIDLPRQHKDITEWFEAGHSELELIAMLEAVHV